MNKFKCSLLALTFLTGPLAGAALAQEEGLVTVDLGNVAPEIATELGIDISEVPASVDVSLAAALEACELDPVEFGDISSCDAFSVTADVLATLEADDDDGDGNDDEDTGDGDDGPSANSAREFAPGQQEGPATDYAPGQQEGPARDHAPGQLKKNDQSDDEAGDE